MPHLQIRDLEHETIAVLRSRAAAEYLTMSQFLRRELRRLAGTATAAQLLAKADDRRQRLDGGVDRAAFTAVLEEP